MGVVNPTVYLKIKLRPDGVGYGEYDHADYETHDDVVQLGLIMTNHWLYDLGFYLCRL